MFSHRLEQSLSVNRIAATIERKRREAEPFADLTLSNPTAAGFEYPAAAITSALSNPQALAYEPSAFGLEDARAAVSSYYARRGIDIHPSRIALTASTSEAYSQLFKLLCDPGDEVLVPRPSYPLFEFLARLESVRVVQYPLFYDEGWHVDVHALEALVTSRSRAIVLVNPNNPTGSYLKQREHRALEALSAEHELALISDEVFSDYHFTADSERISVLASCNSPVLSFSLSGLSKVAGLPQLKLGWIAAGGQGPVLRDAWSRLELIADTYLSVGTPVQVAARRLLEAGETVQQQIRARCSANLDTLRRAVVGTCVSLLHVEGGWYATLQVPRTRSEEVWVLHLLDNHGVLVQPGYFFDFSSEAFLVVSLLTPERTFQPAARTLMEACADTEH